MAKDDDAAVIVFTEETRQSILSKSGSGHWVISPKSVERCKYLVCCRRSDWRNKAEGVPHRAAFLVGRIVRLERLDDAANERGQGRFLIGISEWADVLAPGVWKKELRNPVTYGNLKQLGIELRRLKLRPVSDAEIPDGRAPMTIAEAKKALAVTFGIKPEDIDIIIRG